MFPPSPNTPRARSTASWPQPPHTSLASPWDPQSVLATQPRCCPQTSGLHILCSFWRKILLCGLSFLVTSTPPPNPPPGQPWSEHPVCVWSGVYGLLFSHSLAVPRMRSHSRNRHKVAVVTAEFLRPDSRGLNDCVGWSK